MGSRLSAAFLVPALLAGVVAPPLGAAEVPVSGCRWEAMTRRSPGLVVGKARWQIGTLAVRDEKVIWADARDPGRNLIVPLSRVTGQTLECDDVSSGRTCTEWRLRTRREEFRFRDLLSGPKGSPRLIEIHETVRSALADLPAAPPIDRR